MPPLKSIAGLEGFILAMIKHPEVLRKAQEEIDSTIGHSRLPVFSDRSSLPYIEAMLTETLRWGCPVPLSTFHYTLLDVINSSYRLPTYVHGGGRLRGLPHSKGFLRKGFLR